MSKKALLPIAILLGCALTALPGKAFAVSFDESTHKFSWAGDQNTAAHSIKASELTELIEAVDYTAQQCGNIGVWDQADVGGSRYQIHPGNIVSSGHLNVIQDAIRQLYAENSQTASALSADLRSGAKIYKSDIQNMRDALDRLVYSCTTACVADGQLPGARSCCNPDSDANGLCGTQSQCSYSWTGKTYRAVIRFTTSSNFAQEQPVYLSQAQCTQFGITGFPCGQGGNTFFKFKEPIVNKQVTVNSRYTMAQCGGRYPEYRSGTFFIGTTPVSGDNTPAAAALQIPIYRNGRMIKPRACNLNEGPFVMTSEGVYMPTPDAQANPELMEVTVDACS